MRTMTVVLVVLILLVGGWALWLRGSGWRAPTPEEGPVRALEVKGPEVEAVEAFLEAWSKGDSGAVYGRLSKRMKELVTAEEWAKQMGEMKISGARVVAHTETAPAAFVVARFAAQQPAGSAKVEGANVLLVPEGGEWKVGLWMTVDEVAEKYEDLRIAAGKDGGWVVTYQDEKGMVGTVTLPAL